MRRGPPLNHRLPAPMCLKVSQKWHGNAEHGRQDRGSDDDHCNDQHDHKVAFVGKHACPPLYRNSLSDRPLRARPPRRPGYGSEKPSRAEAFFVLCGALLVYPRH